MRRVAAAVPAGPLGCTRSVTTTVPRSHKVLDRCGGLSQVFYCFHRTRSSCVCFGKSYVALVGKPCLCSLWQIERLRIGTSLLMKKQMTYPPNRERERCFKRSSQLICRYRLVFGQTGSLSTPGTIFWFSESVLVLFSKRILYSKPCGCARSVLVLQQTNFERTVLRHEVHNDDEQKSSLVTM